MENDVAFTVKCEKCGSTKLILIDGDAINEGGNDVHVIQSVHDLLHLRCDCGNSVMY